MKEHSPTNEVLRRNYEDLQQKYLFLFSILEKIKEITGHKGQFNDLPGVVKELARKENG